MSRLRGLLVGLAVAALFGVPVALPARAAPQEERPAVEASAWQPLRARIATLLAAITDQAGDSSEGTSESPPGEGETEAGPKHDPNG